MKSLVDNTKSLFEKGKSLENELSGRLKYEFKTIYRGGMIILKKIEDIHYRVLSERVSIKTSEKILLFSKIFNKL